VLDVADLGALVDDAARTRRHLLDELRDRYAALAHSRLPHLDRLGDVLEERGDGYIAPDSVLARRLRAVLTDARVPDVRFEATPPWLERTNQRVDALIDDWHLVVEADGRAWHTRVRDFEVDRWRDAVALAHGYATVRLTWHQLSRRPAWCRNVLIAIGNRSGPDGWIPTGPAGPTGAQLLVPDRSGPGGRRRAA
jgi:very-short-patch-repair endonuclease